MKLDDSKAEERGVLKRTLTHGGGYSGSQVLPTLGQQYAGVHVSRSPRGVIPPKPAMMLTPSQPLPSGSTMRSMAGLSMVLLTRYAPAHQ